MKIIRISAAWCMSCIIMNQRLDDLKDTYHLEFIDLDIDKDDVSVYEVQDILPVNILLNEKGQEIQRLKGEISTRKLRKLFDTL